MEVRRGRLQLILSSPTFVFLVLTKIRNIVNNVINEPISRLQVETKEHSLPPTPPPEQSGGQATASEYARLRQEGEPPPLTPLLPVPALPGHNARAGESSLYH